MIDRIYWLHTVAAALLLLSACTPPGSGPSALEAANAETPDTGQIELEVGRELVFVLQDNERQPVSAAEQRRTLSSGQGVAVDTVGRAVLHFGERLTLELLRGAELLQIQQSLDDDQSGAVTIAQNGGTVIADLTRLPQARNSLTVQTAFATIAATNARFAVVREADSPLEWVVALETLGDGQVDIMAGQTSWAIGAGQARWISPEGPPSPAIVIDQTVEAWLEGARNNSSQPEIGAVILKPADILASSSLLTSSPRPGQVVEFGRNVHGAISLTMDPQGIFGNPGYEFDDCNSDGVQDLAVRNGVLKFDFRALLARVQALDMTVLNQDNPEQGLLQIQNPAGGVIGQQQINVAAGETQTLSLRSDQPVHFAELRLANACFLGLSLTPSPTPAEPPQPRPAADNNQSGVVVNILSTTAAQLARDTQFQALSIAAGTLQADGSPADWNTLLNRRGLEWHTIAAVTYDSNCANRYPASGSRTDLAGRVQFAYDSQNLYTAFVVEDDGLVTYSGADTRYFLGDSLQLLLDLELTGDFESTQVSSDDIQIDILPDPARPRAALWQLDTLASRQLAGARVAVTLTESGYFMEMTLPWSELGMTPQPGQQFGLVASVNDNDTPNVDTQECIISTSPGRDWQNPTTWGSVVLLPNLTE